MISYPLLICLLGLVIWILFTKWQKIADGWAAEFGKWCFVIGLLVWLLANQLKAVG